MRSMPYFLKDESWYTIHEDEEPRYRLTASAPQEAVDSYTEYYGEKMDFSDNEDIPPEERERLNSLIWE